jgi:hypothetical protein
MKTKSSCNEGAPSRPWLKLALALAILLPACSSTPRIRTEGNASVDYSRFHTFSLMPLPTAVPVSDPGLMMRISDPARQAVKDAFAAKGITEADRTNADIAVNLRGKILPKVEMADWGYRSGPVYGRYGTYYGTAGYRDIDTVTYEDRTLYIEIYDNKAKDLVWVGSSTTEGTGEIQAANVQKAIHLILAEFPPVPAKTK